MKRIYLGYGVILACSLYIFGNPAFAEDKPEFTGRKQLQIKTLDRQISSLQNARACISSAEDPEAVKKCHETMREQRKKNKAERINERDLLLKKSQPSN